MTSADHDQYGKAIGTLHRPLEVLELFAHEQRPLTVGEVAFALEYPQSSTSLLLHGLTNRGYLIHDRKRRTFFPSVRVTFLGMWLHQHILNRGSLLKMMEDLSQKSGHVALLAVQNGLYAQYMHIEAARLSRVGVRPGLLRPICRAAVGKALLSLKPDDEVRKIVHAANAMDAGRAKAVQVDELLKELREARRSGFAYSHNSVTDGSSVVASLVPCRSVGAPIAVGVSVHSEEFPTIKPSIANLLRETLLEHFPQNEDVSMSNAGCPDASRVIDGGLVKI